MIRMAGTALQKTPALLKWLRGGASNTDLALRLGMDGVGATMNAAMTPGDLGDKLITGVTDMGMSSVGGLLAARPFMGKPGIGNIADMAGSMAGAYGSMPVSEKFLQAKDKLAGGKGETPWEKMGREEQQRFAAELENEILAQYGLLYPRTNEYLNPGGLGTGGIG